MSTRTPPHLLHSSSLRAGTGALLTVLAWASGCEEPPTTCDYEASEMSVQSVVRDDGETMYVGVTFSKGPPVQAGDGAGLPLCSGDALRINGEDMKKPIPKTENVYGKVDFMRAPEVNVELVRAKSGQTLTWKVDVPESFVIKSPVADTMISRSKPISVSWATPLDKATMPKIGLKLVDVTLEESDVPCIQTNLTSVVGQTGPRTNYFNGVTIDDRVPYEIPADNLDRHARGKMPNCPVRIVMSRSKKSDPPAGFLSSSSSTASLERSTKFTSIP